MEASTSNQQRSYLKSAHESHLDLLSHGTLSDVTFVVGPSKERIPGHQAFLGARSPVFEVMFNERWNKDNNKEIPLEDIDPKVFKKFLQFIYADTILANVPETLELLQVAHTYDVQLLVRRCEELLLQKEVTLNDAVDIFHAAQKYDKIQLRDKAGDFMAKSLSELQSHPSFSRMDKETLVYILKRDFLDIKEVDLFRLALKWAKNQSDLTMEQSLEDILPLIRFPTMTLEEFTAAVVPSGLLSPSTLVEVFTYFGTDAVTKKSLASTLKLNTRKRRRTDSIHYYDIYPGDLARKETKRLQLGTLLDHLIFSTRLTRTPAMGISGISLYCPARVVNTASTSVSSTFKDFSILLMDLSEILLDMPPAKVEEGKITEIKFDTAVPLVNNSEYLIIVEEIPPTGEQMPASKEDFDVKVFGRTIRDRYLGLNIINQSVVIEGTQEGMDYHDARPQLICRLGLEKL